MLLKDMEPFVRHVVNGRLNAKTENDVFFKLKTPDTRLYYILGGRGKMIIDKIPYEAEVGTVVLFRGGTEYSWNPVPSSYIEYIAVNFDYTHEHSHIVSSYHPIHSELFHDEAVLSSPDFEDAPETRQPMIIPASSIRESRFRALLMDYSMGGELSAPILSSMLKWLLLTVVRESRQKGAKAAIGLVSGVLEYIRENYADEISYDTLGEHFHLSPIYLNRVFRKHLKTSIHEYLLKYRINAAEDMLRSTSLAVKEIAPAVGFADVAHFSKSFKRITGYSPRDYRTAHAPQLLGGKGI